jgi:haloalkane dehalogenase
MPPFPVPAELFPVEHRFVELGGARIHYVDEGAGEPLLLLHGNPTWSFLYRKIIVGLRDEFRCIAPDYPGYGMSDAPPGYRFTPAEHSAMVERLVDELGLTGLTLMVQDWGGPVGLGLACRRPELVARLIIGNTFAWPNRELRVRAFSAVLGGPPGRALTRWFNLAPRVFFARGFAQPVPAEVMRMYLAPWRDRERRLPAAIAPRQLVAASGYLAELEAAVRALGDRPALIVWGQRDFAFRQAARQRFEKLFPDHQTVLLPGASHFLQEDAGEQIASEIRGFLARVS